MSKKSLFSLVTLLGLGIAPSEASAISKVFDPPVAECEWATSVQFRGLGGTLCSGVYVGNDVFLTAAHCFDWDYGEDAFRGRMEFGEIEGEEAAKIRVTCAPHPSYSQTSTGGLFGDQVVGKGPDIAACVIDAANTPEEDLVVMKTAFAGSLLDNEFKEYRRGSIVQPMIPNGCERDYLYDQLYGEGNALDVTTVASGCELLGSEQGSCTFAGSYVYGTTRRVEHLFTGQFMAESSGLPPYPVLRTLQPDPFETTENFPAKESPIKGGDSGGPLFVQMPDGTQRLIGLARSKFTELDSSTVPFTTYNVVTYTPVPTYLHWIEAVTDRDITPCHEYSIGVGWVFDADTCQGVGTSETFIAHGDPEAGGNWGGTCYDYSTRVPVTQCGGWDPGSTELEIPQSPFRDGYLDRVGGLFEPGGVEGPVPTLFDVRGMREVFGGRGDQTLMGAEVADLIHAGSGRDLVMAGAGRDSVLAGRGNDVVHGGDDDDQIYPGPGRDISLGGRGNDSFFVLSSCELESMEVIAGGPGHDVVFSPLSRAEMKARGVKLIGIEEVQVRDTFDNPESCEVAGPVDG